MNFRRLFGLALILPLFIMTGCWDSRELPEQAIWTATGWDIGKKEPIRLSGQFIIPSRIQAQTGGAGGGTGGGIAGGSSAGGGVGRGFFSVTKEGKSVGEALQSMEPELSREVFFGHRKVVLVGEEFARQGLRTRFDANIRSPKVNIRADILVVRGGIAEDAINIKSIFEPVSSNAIIKKHRQIGGRGDKSFLDFLIAAGCDGIRPTIPAIEIFKPDYTKGEQSLRMAGAAIFDKELKLLGYLNIEEDRDLLWILGDLDKRTVSLFRKEGTAGMELIHFHRRIVPQIGRDGQIHVNVFLRADASLMENNTGIDLSRRANLRLLERDFEDQAARQVLRTIRKVQRRYGVDVFGFGEAVHRKHPWRWKSLKRDWDRHFSEAEISVHVDYTIMHEGLMEHSGII